MAADTLDAVEWAFVVSALDGPGDARIDDLYDRADALVSEHAGLTLVTIVSEGGPTAVEAGQSAADTVRACGIEVVRSHPDLVTRSDIAERADVTRQAVTQWLSGKRRQGSFPTPVNAAGGGVWLWGDVHKWLVETHQTKPDGVRYPDLTDHTIIDYQLTFSRVFRVPADLRQRLRLDLALTPAGTYASPLYDKEWREALDRVMRSTGGSYNWRLVEEMGSVTAWTHWALLAHRIDDPAPS